MHYSREKRGSKWSNPVHFERILVRIGRVWPRLSWFSSNPSAKVVKSDRITHLTGENSQWQRSGCMGAPVAGALGIGAGIGMDSLLSAAAPADAKQDLKPAVTLPITRVVLFNSGVGYFSRAGEVSRRRPRRSDVPGAATSTTC